MSLELVSSQNNGYPGLKALPYIDILQIPQVRVLFPKELSDIIINVGNTLVSDVSKLNALWSPNIVNLITQLASRRARWTPL